MARAPSDGAAGEERPRRAHPERHFEGSRALRDIVLGMSDGLTVPFALAAGLSGAAVASRLVVTAGAAELVAGAISMGLGGYLAGKSDVEHYRSERHREQREVVERPVEEEAEVAAIFRGYGLTPEEIAPIVAALRKRPDEWVDFMMRFELGLERPDGRGPLAAAITVGGSYALGGLIPLFPYVLVASAAVALRLSIAVTLVALVVFGWWKGRLTGGAPLRSALETSVIGALAAAVAFLLARLVA